MRPSVCLAVLALSVSTHALKNVTVDDTKGDEVTGGQITYSPASSWNLGASCSGCTAHIQANQTYDGTWHDGTYYPVGASGAKNPGQTLTAEYTFNGKCLFEVTMRRVVAYRRFAGTAIYVYCLIARTSTSPDGNTDMTFYIDGTSVGTYELAPDNDTTIYYDQLVYSNTGLSSGSHDFKIVNGMANQKSLVLLDRLVYTTDDSSNSTSSTSSSSKSSSTSSKSSSTSAPHSNTITSIPGLTSTSLSVGGASPTSTTTSAGSPRAGGISFIGLIGSVFGAAGGLLFLNELV